MKHSSDFEVGWIACPPGNAIVQRRSLEYDRHAGLLFAPAKFDYRPIQLAADLPTDEWIEDNLVSFVRGEFVEERTAIASYPGLPSVASGGSAPRSMAIDYLERCESLVYGGYLDGLLTAAPNDLAHQVHAILVDSKLGNRRNARNLTVEDISRDLDPRLRSKLRLRFVLPAFPFKDQNPFRTSARASSPDFADVALLVHMHIATQALYQVHPHGVDWVVLSDGLTYSRIFGVDDQEATDYLSRLSEWRDWLNLANTVSIVDLSDLIRRLDGCKVAGDSGQFSRVVATLRTKLRTIFLEAGREMRNIASVLKRGMAWNLNTRSYLDRFEPDHLWLTLKSVGTEFSSASDLLAAEIDERAFEAAIEYASVNLALRYLDAIELSVPDAIRSTIHPKPGQIAAPSVGQSAVFPWNGVPVSPSATHEPNSLIVDGLSSHRTRYPSLTAFIDNDTGDPFFYVPNA